MKKDIFFRGYDKICDIMQSNGNKKVSVVKLEEGGTLTEWGVGKLAKKSKALWPEKTKSSLSLKKTNIKEYAILAMKSRSRDAILQEILESGEYVFPNMFMVVNPYGESPLSALVLFQTKEECKVRVTVIGKSLATDFSYVVPSQILHRVPILGLYPKRKNAVRIELLGENDKLLKSRMIYVTTRGLPRDLRKVISVKQMSEDPAIKNILITGGVDIKCCAFDQTGDIRFYLSRVVKGYGIFPTSHGHYIFMEKAKCNATWTNPQCSVYHDMDYLGRVHKTYLSDNGLHHTIEEKVNGNLLIGTNTVDTEYCEDAMAEVDCHTGEIVWELHFEDLFGGAYKDMTDWAHINSAVYNKENNTMLISLRNVHAVICVDYDTKKLRWIMSDPEFWKGTPVEDLVLQPVGDIKWFYQQHSAFWVKEDMDGNPDTRQIMMFDNHWHKRRPAKSFDGDMKYSYISFYSVNEKEKTVSLLHRVPCRKSQIRGNGIYLHEQKRVYSMEGAFAKKYQESVGEWIGGIYEYDYETGEQLSEILVKPGFFRAYEFKPELEDLSQPQEQNEAYLLGNLKKPVVMEEKDKEGISFDGRKISKQALRYQLREKCLFIREVDHHLKKVYFHGKEHDYILHLDTTEQVYGTYFGHSTHYLSMEIDELPKDYYEIYVNYDGDFGYTGKYIQIG